LLFNAVGFCPNVSEYHNKLIDPHNLVKPQDRVKRRLDGRTDRQRKD